MEEERNLCPGLGSLLAYSHLNACLATKVSSFTGIHRAASRYHILLFLGRVSIHFAALSRYLEYAAPVITSGEL